MSSLEVAIVQRTLPIDSASSALPKGDIFMVPSFYVFKKGKKRMLEMTIFLYTTRFFETYSSGQNM